ncbi:MAG TPA: hypothetical protein PKE04_19600, partial [Clostridia bacterium]|nr:hypothetical protein [Clostridia bacterium]
MRTLTSKERLARLFSRQPIDRIPMWMLFPSRKWHLAADVFDHPSYKELTRVIHDETDHVCRMSFPTGFLLNAHPDVHDRREGKRHTVRYKDKVFVSDTIVHNDHSEVIPLCKSLEDLETLLELPFEMCQADTSSYAEEIAALGDRGLPCIMVPGPLSMTRAVFSETEFTILYATE